MKAFFGLLALYFCLYLTQAIDFESELEHDSEFEDELDAIKDLEESSQENLVDTLLELTQENDFITNNDALEDENEAEREFIQVFDDDIKRQSFDTRFTNMLRKIGKHHGIRSPYPKEGSCSVFLAQKTTTHRCTTEKTLLGSVTACKLTCRKGQKLKHAYPHYELCGAATKWRWTYELRGENRAAEICVRGHVNTRTTSTCTSANCMATAAYYMEKIDYKMNPCDDFYEYSCGKWLKETPFPPSSPGRYQTYSVLRNRVKRDMARLLKKPIKTSEISSIKKAKIVYQSCMDTDRINSIDARPLHRLLREELTWPIINEDWKNSEFDLESALATLRGRYHNNILFKVRVGPSEGNYILQTWKGKMALPKKYYLSHRYANRKAAYSSLMKDTAVMLGADEDTAAYDTKKVLKFETEIALLKIFDHDYFTEKSISDMNSEIPGIDWLKLFKRMIWTSDITSDTMIQVWNVKYLRDLIKLIRSTDPRIVQNYMVWRFVKHRIRNLDERFQNRYLKYEYEMVGRKALKARWYTCSNYLITGMQGPTGKMFIDKFFSPEKKKTAEEMFNNIRKGFISLLDKEVDWMDEKTKKYAKEKALAIIPYIGYNKHVYENNTYLNTEWEKLIVKKYDYFGNVLRILTQVSQNSFKKLGTTYDKKERGQTNVRPTMVNAFYSPTHNSITLPAGEMQYPFYWGDKFPRMFQYGAIGTILGHEITHGFDNIGSTHDKYGRLRNWWSSASLREFKKRTKCIANQYSNYYWKAAGENIDGGMTLSENIADNGGIRESYAGYQIWLKSQNITGEEIEPATGLTNNQMFFVGFANVRCAKYTHRAAEHAVVTSVHSPGRYRVIGSLQNFDKFSEAFHCKPKSFMNPEKKCIVW